MLGLASLALVPLYHWKNWKVTTRTRKIFHVAVLAVYTSGLAFSPLLLALASVGAALALIGLEIIRVSKVVPNVSTILTNSLQPFLDSKEGGGEEAGEQGGAGGEEQTQGGDAEVAVDRGEWGGDERG